MIKFNSGQMVTLEEWSSYSKKIPLVAVIGLMNEWMLIYACLQQAVKNFDYILVIGDGISQRAREMYDKFILDHPKYADKINIIELGDLDPWPWVAMARPNSEYNSIDQIPKKSWSKAGFKRFNYARAAFPNSILCSLHADVIVFDDTGLRIRDRMSRVEDPFFDSEWFSMITMHDRHSVESILSPDSGPGNHKPNPFITQRTTYDYPGDWGLMAYYASSMLSVGPDPGGHEAECFYPWSHKTQVQKKGRDTSIPHAIHLEWVRESCINKSFEKTAWKIVKRSWIEENDKQLGSRMGIIDNLFFPIKFYLDEKFILRISQ